MKMLHGFPQRSAVFPAVGKCPRNSDSTHGVKPVRILNDLSLHSFRNLSPVPAEGHGIDTCADPLNIVMKTTLCNGMDVAKISDTPGKGMCKNEAYVDYLERCIKWRMENS